MHELMELVSDLQSELEQVAEDGWTETFSTVYDHLVEIFM